MTRKHFSAQLPLPLYSPARILDHHTIQVVSSRLLSKAEKTPAAKAINLSMVIPNARRRNPLAALYLHLAVVAGFNTVTAQAQVPPPPQLPLLRETTGRTVPTTAITVAAIVLFVLVLFCVLINQWRRSSSAGTDASAGGWHASVRRRGRGLDPAAVAALPVVPYAEIRKHKSGGGGLECAVCLTAFDDGDELRLLPQCSHAFHPDCIDPWLEDHVTCPLCRANLETPVPPPAVPLSSPETETKPPQTLEAVAARVVEVENDVERREETVQLEKLRCARRAARMPRSRSTGHSTSTVAAGDHERFTVRLPPHVLEEVLKSGRLRHATSLVIRLGGGASNCEGIGSACAVGGETCHGARRRWSSFLATTTSWAQSVAEGSAARRGGMGPDAGTRKPPCGHVVCSTAARWPARCKARNLD